MHRVTWSLPDHIWPWALVQTSLFSKSNTEIKYKLNYSRTIKRIKARIMLSVLNWNKSVKNNAPFAKLCLKIMLAQSTNKSAQFEIQLKRVLRRVLPKAVLWRHWTKWCSTSLPGSFSSVSLVVGIKTLVAAGHVTTCDTNFSTGVQSANRFCRSEAGSF